MLEVLDADFVHQRFAQPVVAFVTDPFAGSQDKQVSRRNPMEAVLCFIYQGIGLNSGGFRLAPEGIELAQQGLTILLKVGSVEAEVKIVEPDRVHVNWLRGRR
ncbi:hypothetical protein D3C85_1247460 [compost metagenome]